MNTKGFTLVELVAVIVIVGVLAITVTSRFTGSSTMQLQASRDSVVAALVTAQQLAMAQTDPVQVSFNGSSVNVLRNTGNGYTSINFGGVQYPLDISPTQVDGVEPTLDFDRLGRTTATEINLELNGSVVTINMSPSGFSQ